MSSPSLPRGAGDPAQSKFFLEEDMATIPDNIRFPSHRLQRLHVAPMRWGTNVWLNLTKPHAD